MRPKSDAVVRLWAVVRETRDRYCHESQAAALCNRSLRRDSMIGRLLRLFAVTLAVALPLAVGSTAAQEDTFLAIAQDPAVGSFLTDAEGNTLYLFTPDTTAGESACNDDCAAAWP